MKPKGYVLIALICAVFVFTNDAAAPDAWAAQKDTIPEGVYIGDMDMSGRTEEEARTQVDSYVSQLTEGELHLTAGDAALKIPLADIGFSLKDTGPVDEACAFGRRGNIVLRYREIEAAKNKPVHFKLEFTCSRSLLEQVLNEKAGEINKEPVNALIRRSGGEFMRTPEQNGWTLDVGKTADRVMAALQAWDRQDTLKAALAVSEKAPGHTLAELSAVEDRLGSYTTSFAASSANRIANIKNGTAKLDGVIVYPGEEFSFLSYMVPFTAEGGYYPAGTYVNGKSVDGMGGGICQVSSTLYNAVLRAELTVTQRTNHMMTVGYVPLGADATIANPGTDFKFRNDFEFPVYIEAYTSGTNLTVSIYGDEWRPPNRTVEFISVTEKTIPPGADVVTYDASKPKGYREVTQGAHTGYVAAFYKNIYVDGSLTEQLLINRSQYGAYPRYITVGP